MRELLYGSTFKSDIGPWFFCKITPFSTFNLRMEMGFISDIFIHSFLLRLASVNEMVSLVIIKM